MTDVSGLKAGLSAEATAVVDDARSAITLGSGSVPVFATPAMIALMEQAADRCAQTELPPSSITLGTHIDVAHVAPTALGASVTARAEITAVDGRLIRFSVTAHEGSKTIGRGTHTRMIVDRQRFLAKLGVAG